MIDQAVRALCDRQPELVSEIIDMDGSVDLTEVFIENEGLKLLALHQPVASDLRQVCTVLKINGELERIADLACNIAERARDLHQQFPNFPVPDIVPEMTQQAVEMVRSSLDSYVGQDVDLAKHVIELDHDLDHRNREAIQLLIKLMKDDPELIEPSMHCFSAVRQIERIGDHAENIAEDVIYLIDGEIVRHNHEELGVSD